MLTTESTHQQTRTAVVMMVDDDPQLRVMLGYALRQEGFQVEEASTGEDAPLAATLAAAACGGGSSFPRPDISAVAAAGFGL